LSVVLVGFVLVGCASAPSATNFISAFYKDPNVDLTPTKFEGQWRFYGSKWSYTFQGNTITIMLGSKILRVGYFTYSDTELTFTSKWEWHWPDFSQKYTLLPEDLMILEKCKTELYSYAYGNAYKLKTK
jgi:hypothetical protein